MIHAVLARRLIRTHATLDRPESARGSVVSMKLTRAALAGAAALALTLTACSSDDTETVSLDTCPTEVPADGSADWEFTGTTGSVTVTGPTASQAPLIVVDAPFSVDETVVQTLSDGNGEIVSDSATVNVCYVGVNGRDGTTFDNAYERGAPVEFPLTGVVTGFQKAIAGQSVGSTVAVAMTSDDGYGQGNPSAGIEAGDTLIFAISILSAQN